MSIPLALAVLALVAAVCNLALVTRLERNLKRSAELLERLRGGRA